MTARWKADFEEFFEIIKRHEGWGVTEHPNDDGGLTNTGISARWYSKQFKIPIDEAREKVRKLTENEIKEIYYDYFYSKFSECKNKLLRFKLADVYVNTGEKGLEFIAKELKYRSLYEFLSYCNEVIDNVTAQSIVNQISIAQARYYISIIEKRASKMVFLRGWLRRAMFLAQNGAIHVIKNYGKTYNVTL